MRLHLFSIALLSTLASGSIYSAAFAATVTGGEGPDVLTGTSSNDTMNGRGGNDEIYGLGGDDSIQGGDDDDEIEGGEGDDIIDGNAGVDSISGGAGNDQITDIGVSIMRGGADNDVLKAASVDEILGLEAYGEDGNDTIEGRFFKIADGGAGDDHVKISLTNPSTSDGPQNPDWIFGGEGYDVLSFGWGGPVCPGITEDYCLEWSRVSGFEELFFEYGYNRSIVFPDSVGQSGTVLKVGVGRGYDGGGMSLDFSSETDAILNIQGSDGTDILFGGHLNDNLEAFGNVDNITGGPGDDRIDGGDGIDTAAFSGNKIDYTITELTYNTFKVQDNRLSSPDGTDTVIDVNKLQFANETVEVVIRGLFIVGDDTNEVFVGGAQSDFIDGAGGDDSISAGFGNDTEIGGTGSDTMTGGPGNDFVFGDERIETTKAIAKASTANAAADIDTINYSKAKAAITVNLKAGQAKSIAAGDLAIIGVDTLVGIENIRSGPFDDLLRGSQGNNFIDGGRGRDTVIMSGKRKQYKVTYSSGSKSYTVVDKVSGRDGTDTLKNIEVLRFSDSSRVLMSVSQPSAEGN